MSKKVIITGSNGQLGQYLIKYLQDRMDAYGEKYEIIGTVRHKSYDKQDYIFDLKRMKFDLMELADPHSIESLVVKCKPDYFINTSANAFVGESWALPYQQIELNTIGVLHQLEAIRKHSPSTRYFNMGTSEEFACSENNGPQNENTKIWPKSPYGCSKAAARYLVNVYRQSYGLYAIQGWTFNFESKLRHTKYVTGKVAANVARIFVSLERGNDFEPLEVGNIYSYRSWQAAEDVADGIWRSLNQEVYRKDLQPELYQEGKYSKDLVKPLKEYVLSVPETYTVKEFIERAFAHVGIFGAWSGQGVDEVYKDINTSRVLVKINPEFFRPLDVTFLHGDSSMARKELGWKPKVDFQTIIAEMVNYHVNLEKKQ